MGVLDDIFSAEARDQLPKPYKVGHVTYHPNLFQGSDEWLQARRGMLTASQMSHIMTPTLKIASSDKARQHLYELLAQRITGHVEPHYISDDMLRGMADEADAVQTYAKHYGEVEHVGFITNDRWGFTLGYSPDGMVGYDGLVECKSRRQKYQAQTIVQHVAIGGGLTIPDQYVLQCQTGLLVSERKWMDFISYCAGMPMAVIRVHPDDKIHAAIIEAAAAFEERLADALQSYRDVLASGAARLIPTERKERQEIML
jgi:predicted phage-related endonuclease